MFHARDDWTAATLPAQRPPAAFGRRAERPAVVVDLAQGPFSAEWWRGATTLMLLCATALALAPGLEPLAGGRIESGADPHQAEALGIAPLARGSATGLRLVETAAVEPLVDAPERARVELFLTLGRNDRIGNLLARVGATLSISRLTCSIPRLLPTSSVLPSTRSS